MKNLKIKLIKNHKNKFQIKIQKIYRMIKVK